MSDLQNYQDYGEELERRLKLKTFPLAIKLLEQEEDIPDHAKRPLKDFGYHLSLCQGYQVAIPCRGDHYSAMASENEMIFTIPEAKINDIMAGLRYVEKTDSKLPRGYRIYPEYPLPEAYEKIAKIMDYR